MTRPAGRRGPLAAALAGPASGPQHTVAGAIAGGGTPALAAARGGAEPAARKLLAVASGGGHWEQLLLIRDAFAGCRTHYATTMTGLRSPDGAPVTIVPDCNRNEPLRAAASFVAVATLTLRFRPDIVVTTGALPGLFAVIVGKRLGARTLWLDSLANAEEMSRSGLHAAGHADRWLSQWPMVAEATGAEHHGAVM